QLRDYPTLAHAIQFVHERRPARPGAEAAVAAPAAAEDDSEGEAGPGLVRRVPVAVLRPALELCKPTGVELAEGHRVVLMPDRGGVGRALTRRLEQRGVQVLTLAADLDADALTRQLETWRGEGPVHGVYWLPALDGEGDATELTSSAWRDGLHLRVKLLYATARCLYEELGAPGRFLVCATRLGGRHGYDGDGAVHPMGGAVVGFAKAFARERLDALVKAVDFPVSRKTAELADALIAETVRDPGSVEVGVVGEDRFTVALGEAPPDDGEGIALGRATVAVVTGAAGGIVSAITADLARAGVGTFHLLDLTPAPDPADEDVSRFGNDRDGLQRAIFERLKAGGERVTPVLVERELARIERLHEAASALRAIADAGGTAHWHEVDLTDGEAVERVVESIRQESGRIDLLVHAAGLEVSRALPEKQPQEFDRVFDVKCDGWFHLLRASRDLPLGSVVLFSSIAGRFGNAGQADYSAANDLLCKFASNLRRTRPKTRALAIDWTAWSQIGMASRGSIPEIMARAGIDMLSPGLGVPLVRTELCRGGATREVVAAGALGILLEERDETGGLDTRALEAEPHGPMLGSVLGMGVEDGLRVSTRLDPREQPFLDDHRIDGTAVLPGVMGVEAFVAAASLPFPGAVVQSIENVAFLAPFKFYRDEPREFEVQVRFTRDGGEILADCRLLGRRTLAGADAPRETVHFTGRVRLGAEAPVLPARDPAPAPGKPVLESADLYRFYFHGPAYRVVGAAWRSGDEVIGRFAGDLPPNHTPESQALATRPRLLELCFQTAGAGEIASTGRMGLPRSIARVRLGSGAAQGACAVVAAREPGSAADVVVVDADGRVLLELEGYATVALPEPLDAPPLRAALG
ncbi:MAG: SDR family NAD(P)-dependent oxidoreductase, partial [Myxococcales bacterium]|nr:SDR family NAD(P)-dependent oxidoreductase [Myxococcales bacterium]